MALKQSHFPSELDSQEARIASHQTRPGARDSAYRRTHSPLLQDDEAHLNGLDEPPRTPTMDMAMQDAMLDQRGDRSPDQQRGAGNRYSAANTTSSRRPNSQSSPPQSQSAFFSGPPRVDQTDDMASAGRSSGNPRRRVPRHSRRQSESLDAALSAAEPGKPPQQNGNGALPHGMPAAYHEAAAREVQIPPQQQQQQHQRQPQSPPRGAVMNPSSGPDIDRLGSPSIATSVLKPLESKMREYHELMDDAERQLAQLDDELIALQERRRQAEDRYADAKSKHDTYQRQHADVERALRGEFQSMHLPQHHQGMPPQHAQHLQQQQQQFGSRPSLSRPRPPSIDSYDERPVSGQSHGTKGRSRFRLSLFK